MRFACSTSRKLVVPRNSGQEQSPQARDGTGCSIGERAHLDCGCAARHERSYRFPQADRLTHVTRQGQVNTPADIIILRSMRLCEFLIGCTPHSTAGSLRTRRQQSGFIREVGAFTLTDAVATFRRPVGLRMAVRRSKAAASHAALQIRAVAQAGHLECGRAVRHERSYRFPQAAQRTPTPKSYEHQQSLESGRKRFIQSPHPAGARTMI
jgi:hypothetical protein